MRARSTSSTLRPEGHGTIPPMRRRFLRSFPQILPTGREIPSLRIGNLIPTRGNLSPQRRLCSPEISALPSLKLGGRASFCVKNPVQSVHVLSSCCHPYPFPTFPFVGWVYVRGSRLRASNVNPSEVVEDRREDSSRVSAEGLPSILYVHCSPEGQVLHARARR